MADGNCLAPRQAKLLDELHALRMQQALFLASIELMQTAASRHWYEMSADQFDAAHRMLERAVERMER